MDFCDLFRLRIIMTFEISDPPKLIPFFMDHLCHLSCNESQSHEVNGVGSIPVWSGGMDFEEI